MLWERYSQMRGLITGASFVSFFCTRPDPRRARKRATSINTNTHSTWTLTKTAGQLLVDEMRRPVLHARVMVVLMNPAYANSFNCGHELLATLRYRDPRKGHRTVVLLEEWNEKGFAPRWSKIRKQLLEKELGIDAVCKTVDELLVWLDEHAIHAESAIDADLTL